ncbi:MAG: hypothetical protein K5756_03815 [Clostridiales bacterium]|nr:hypothetical protein [Clostridiales bacterium]
MFVVLQPEKRDNGLLSRLSGWLHPYEPQLTQVAVKNGAPFFTLDCPEIFSKKEGSYLLPWDKIVSAVGRCFSRMLIPERIIIPRGIPINRFVPRYLPYRILVASVASILRECRLKPSDIHVAVIDSTGILSDDIEQLIMLSSCIKILTNRRRKYEEISIKLMKKYGAVLIIADDCSSINNCNFLITTYDKSVPKGFDGFVFCVSSENETFYSLNDIELPYEYEKLVPQDINRLDFAGALYELCGAKKLLETRVISFRKGGAEIKTGSLYRFIN